MLNPPEPLVRFTRTIRAVRDPKLHEAVVRRFLEEASPGEAVEGIRVLMTAPDQPGYRSGYNAIVSFVRRGRGLSYGRLEALYRAAFGLGYAPVRFLLLNAPPRLVARPDEVLPDPEIMDIALGRRKSLARGHQRDLLLRLMFDPTIPVLQLLLQNPKILEDDVVRIATRRPNMTDVLAYLGEHPKWMHRYSVQRSLVQNPYAPTSLAVAFVPFLVGKHLVDVAQDARLHDGLRESAATIRTWRLERRKGPRQHAPAGGTQH